MTSLSDPQESLRDAHELLELLRILHDVMKRTDADDAPLQTIVEEWSKRLQYEPVPDNDFRTRFIWKQVRKQTQEERDDQIAHLVDQISDLKQRASASGSVRACPHCQALGEVDRVWDEEFAGRAWTDGRCVLTRIPISLSIARCIRCNQTFWVEDAEGQIPSFNSPEPDNWSSLPEFKPLDEEQLLDAIDLGLGDTPERTFYLRRAAWWAFNDQRRMNQDASADPVDPSSRRGANMLALSECCTDYDIEHRFLQVEIAREFGQFDRALELLSQFDLTRSLKDIEGEDDIRVPDVAYLFGDVPPDEAYVPEDIDVPDLSGLDENDISGILARHACLKQLCLDQSSAVAELPWEAVSEAMMP